VSGLSRLSLFSRQTSVSNSSPAPNPCDAPAAPQRAVEPSGWWLRPCGGRDVLAIALPLVIQSAFWSVMWFVDRLYLSWYSQDATAAALPGGMFHWVLICLPTGIASFVNTFVAQYHGAGRPRRIGVAVNQGIWFGWATVPLFLLAIPVAPFLFRLVNHEVSVQRLEVIYFQVLALGAGAVVISNAQSSFYTGRGLTGIVMLVNAGGTLLDICLEYAFIFGAFGLPEMGIAGAALTTVISNWATVLAFWWLLRRPAERETFGLDNDRLDWEIIRRLIRFGLPSGLPQFIEAGAFTFLTNAVTAVSVVAGAATSLAFAINALAFVPMIGLNIAVSTIVGQKLGENRPDLAERATWTAMLLAMGYTGLCAMLYLIVPDWFLVLHTAFANDPTFPAVRQTTIGLLWFVALYCFFDATQIVLVGALRGAGDTRFVLYNATAISAISITTGLFLERYFGWKQSGYGLYGWWWIMTVWLLFLCLTYLLRFKQGRWKSIRVIEPELPDDEPPAGEPVTDLVEPAAEPAA